jgi:tRNA dimethylallyltransferase
MVNKQDRQTIHIIAGPTASGKSARALEVALAEDGEIVNCDSMQVYDDLPLLTAQPPAEDRDVVPHHLYGALHPNDVCSAGNWREMAEPLLHDILETNKTPIVVGGSGLYIKALMEGLSPMPDIPQDVRTAVVERYEEIGAEAFYKELEMRDPIMAARFHINHKARTIRAMEVLEATGKSLAEWQKETRLSPPKHWRFEVEVIIPERPILHERCNTRFEWMMDHGVLEEIESFAARVEGGRVKNGVPLTKALGYQPLLAYIKGEMSREEAISQSQARTRQYAKQQVTWFRNQLIAP